MNRNARLAAGLTVVLVAAGAGWVGGRQISSPAEEASKTAAPTPSLILVPVEKRALTSEVVTRGAVRFGAPQKVALPTSALKRTGAIVTSAPIKGAVLKEGDTAMTVSGRPVLILQGDKPSYRDLAPGSTGGDVEQLERALVRIGLDPGPVDRTYDARTAAAVAAWYTDAGWDPFGPTEDQLLLLRTAQSETFLAESELLKEQETVELARGTLAAARSKLERARAATTSASQTDAAVAARLKSEHSAAVAAVANKTAALDGALDAERVAQLRLGEAQTGDPTVPTPSELLGFEAASRGATRAVATARAELTAAQVAVTAANVAFGETASVMGLEAVTAETEFAAAARVVEVAQRRVELFASRATATRVEEIVAKLGIQIPADEVLFFPSLPLRVDTANVVVGEQLLGPVMTVTNSRLAVDAALSLDDTRLVKVGSPVTITEPELGLRINGTVGLIADTPGTLGAEAQRFHIEINPIDAPASLVGASVVLSVTVNSTQGKVLAVPVAALSVSADGASRVQVQSADKSTKFVTVTPGLTANGLVAVTPLRDSLSEGDLIVVGAGAARSSGSPGDIVNIGSATTVSTSGTETKSSTTKGS